MSPVPASVGEEGQAGPKPEQMLSIREGARAPGRQQLAAPDGSVASRRPSCSCLGLIFWCHCHGQRDSPLRSRPWQRPPGRSSFLWFPGLRPSAPLLLAAPKPALRSPPSSLCVTHLRPVPPPFRSHAGGIFSERLF